MAPTCRVDSGHKPTTAMDVFAPLVGVCRMQCVSPEAGVPGATCQGHSTRREFPGPSPPSHGAHSGLGIMDGTPRVSLCLFLCRVLLPPASSPTPTAPYLLLFILRGQGVRPT